MRLFLDMRAERLLRRFPFRHPEVLVELVILALLAWVAARLIWAVVVPLDPIGQWPTRENRAPINTVLSAFDPFFRNGSAAPAEVTSADLKLFGVRQDRASGRGGAIIGLPDGSQSSFVPGETVMPGVTLDAVDFDNVTLLRNGRRELLFLDQSIPAELIDNPAAPAPAAPPIQPPSAAPLPADNTHGTVQ
ncbi:MAG: type II secretion system protein N [Sphingomonadaceae bacterium]